MKNIMILVITFFVTIFVISIFSGENEPDTSDDGPSKREIQIADMSEKFSSIRSATDFKTTTFYNKTDIQRENWENANKDKLHLVVDKIYEVKRKTEKLTATGGYNRYLIQFEDDIESGAKKAFTDSNYKNIGFQCENVYAYNEMEKMLIENLQVGRKVTFLAKNIELGSLWHTADICVLKGIHN